MPSEQTFCPNSFCALSSCARAELSSRTVFARNRTLSPCDRAIVSCRRRTDGQAYVFLELRAKNVLVSASWSLTTLGFRSFCFLSRFTF